MKRIAASLSLAAWLGAATATAAETTAPPAQSPASPEAATPATVSAGSVARAVFTTAVQDHEPVDGLTTLTNDATQVVFFTEIRDMAGRKAVHRWEYQDKVMAEVPFEIGGARWRVFSRKTLDPSWTGEWKVSVVDEAGGTLGASTFTYAPAAAAPPAAPAAETPKAQ